MNPITHALTGWCLAEAMPNVTTREKALITIAAIAPDIDGFGVIAELATRNGPHPLFWWTDYHHLLGHNLIFAIAASLLAALAARTARATTAACVFIAVQLHILGDLAGSRGPDGYQWPIPYLYPLDAPPLAWSLPVAPQRLAEHRTHRRAPRDHHVPRVEARLLDRRSPLATSRSRVRRCTPVARAAFVLLSWMT